MASRGEAGASEPGCRRGQAYCPDPAADYGPGSGDDLRYTCGVILKERPSPNHNARPRDGVVDMLVLHYTGMQSAEAALDRLCDSAAAVSAHYLIEENGTLWRLVREDRRAWHAGVAYWRGHRDINARSIGIELVNPGHEFGYRPFPKAQMETLATVARDLLGEYAIPARNVVGHSDVAPTRKQDPGELFDWHQLAAAGIGLWPTVDAAATADATELLRRIGYEAGEALSEDVTAFQRHWLPDRISGEVCGETLRRMQAVADLL